MRTGPIKELAQDKRMEFFDVDYTKYFEILDKTAEEEKKAYDDSFNTMFDKLCITQANFERSQQQMMQQDPAS